jgi:quercetin 2,3-dioxygenase
MVTVYPYEQLGQHTIEWLEARYHFSFMYYYNPARLGFGTLKVINDDIVKAGGGFDTHPHKDMEIITYVRQGAITHKDSEGNKGRTEAGSVQVMSAGSGIFHSEYNAEDEDTRLYQIWIEPNTKKVKPRWESAVFPRELQKNKLQLLVSGYPEDKNTSALFIHQSACIYGGRLAKGAVITHPIRKQAYILLSEGNVEIEGNAMKKGDGAEVTDSKEIKIMAKEESEILVVDVPKW